MVGIESALADLGTLLVGRLAAGAKEILIGAARGIVRQQLAVPLRLRSRRAFRQAEVLGDGLGVDRTVLELRRALDDLLRDAEPNDLVAVGGVGKCLRHGVPGLYQQPVLDDHVPVADLDNVTDLAVVAGDDLEPFHRNLPFGWWQDPPYPQATGN